MSTPVTYVGNVYSVPAYQDTGYAQGAGNLSSYLIALATGSLTLSGGTFTLTADVDFGASFGLKASYYKSRSSNVSVSGIFRLANNSDAISYRNAANSADLSLTANATNYLTFNGAGLNLSATSNQFVLGTTNTTTVSFTAPASSRVYTIPDAGTNTTFILADGTQTIIGSKTFSSAILAASGTVNNPGVTFSAGNTDGLYRIGVNDIAIATNGTLALEFTSGQDVQTVAYQDYSGTSTIVGWASFTTKLIYYKKIGKLVWVWWDLRGTSNTTTVTFTLPFTAANTVSHRMCSDTTDNGVRTTTGGEGVLPGNSSTVQVYKDMSQAVWTNSGTKEAIGMIFYQTT